MYFAENMLAQMHIRKLSRRKWMEPNMVAKWRFECEMAKK